MRNKEFMESLNTAGIRVIKTVAQMALANIVTAAIMSEVN